MMMMNNRGGPPPSTNNSNSKKQNGFHNSPPPPTQQSRRPSQSQMQWPEIDRILFILISDFLRRRSLNKTADMLGMELEMDLNHAFVGMSQQLPALLHSPVGFLADWFVVFWELFLVRNLKSKPPANKTTNSNAIPYIRTPEQEAMVRKALLQKLMSSVGMGNREISTLSAEERRWLSHLMQRYSSTNHIPPNPLPLSPALSNSPPPIIYSQQASQIPVKRPRKEDAKRGEESIDQYLINPHAINPDELMASLVQGQNQVSPSPASATACDLVFKKEISNFSEKLSCLSFAGPGGELAVGLRNGSMSTHGTTSRNFPTHHSLSIMQVRWYKQSMLASASLDKSVKILHLKEDFRSQHFLGHNAPVYSVEFINRSTLVSSDGDGHVKFWNIGTSDCIKELLLTAGSSVSARPLKYVKDLGMLVVANGDSLIFIDDSQFDIQCRTDTGLGKSITCLSLHERRLILATVDTLSIFSLEKYSATLKGTRNVGDKVTAAAWVHGKVAIGGWNRIRLFDDTLVRELGGVEYAHQGIVVGVCATFEGTMVSIGHDGLVKEWIIKEREQPDMISSVDTLDVLFAGIQQPS